MKKYFIGNFKTYVPNVARLRLILKTYNFKKTKIVLCPSYVHILKSIELLKGRNIAVGAQDVNIYGTKGKTGNVTPDDLAALKTKFCIIGHTETRFAGVTNKQIAEKMNLLMEKKITPIVCLTNFGKDKFNEIKTQIEEIFRDMDLVKMKHIIIAYEPSSNIGQDSSLAYDEIRSMTLFIKKILRSFFNENIIADTTILYGGSVDETNIIDILGSGVDGVLVGRASISIEKIKKFNVIL